MVEKHKLDESFEKITYTSKILRNEWIIVSERIASLIVGGWTTNVVLEFVKYILQTSFPDHLFPGTSMGTLLISKPLNGKLNFQQTLAISFDKKKGLILLKYSDWNKIDKKEDSKNAILWSAEIIPEKLKSTFQEFIEWNKDWNF